MTPTALSPLLHISMMVLLCGTISSASANRVSSFHQVMVAGKRGGSSQQPASSGPRWSNIRIGVWVDKNGVGNNDFTGDHYGIGTHFFKPLKEIEPRAYLSSIVIWNSLSLLAVDAREQPTPFPISVRTGDCC